MDKINAQDGFDEKHFKSTAAKNDGRKNSSKPVQKRTGNSKVASKALNERENSDRGKTVASRSAGSSRRESSPEALNQDEEEAKNKPSISSSVNAQAVGAIQNVASKPPVQLILNPNVVLGETSPKTIANSESSQVKPGAMDTNQDVQQCTSSGQGKDKGARPSRETAKSRLAAPKRKAQEQPSESKGKKSARKRSKSSQKRKSQSRKRSGRKIKKSGKATVTSQKRTVKKKQ